MFVLLNIKIIPLRLGWLENKIIMKVLIEFGIVSTNISSYTLNSISKYK